MCVKATEWICKHFARSPPVMWNFCGDGVMLLAADAGDDDGFCWWPLYDENIACLKFWQVT